MERALRAPAPREDADQAALRQLAPVGGTLAVVVPMFTRTSEAGAQGLRLWTRRRGCVCVLAYVGCALAACGSERSDLAGAGGGTGSCSTEGAAEYCYPGPPTAGGIGECTRGTRSCVGGAWSACEGYGLPVDEICDDFLDNDCDGSSDEGCPCEAGSILPCYSGSAATRAVGLCSDGEQRCLDSVWASECTGEVLPTADEPCNALDDDCNGVVDDGCACTAGATRDCYSAQASTRDVGECHDGTQSCVGAVWGTTCAGEVAPSPERCNGLDDDCDGIDDEGLGETSCGLGPCAHTVQNCVDGAPQACDPMAGSTTETCDGADNNCDGVADEGCSCVNGTTQSCYTGLADTQDNPPCHSGTQLCSNGAWGACNGEVTPATSETCNAVDDDCDGSIDEDLSSSSCGVGPCAHSQPSCVSGVPQPCNPYQGASAEICDNVDNDCNGTIDDGSPSGGTEVTFATQSGWDGFCENGLWLGYQRIEAACRNFEPDGLTNSRGFLSFDTSSLGVGATVNSATLRLCGTGGPGAEEALLFQTSFGLNLTCSAYDAPATFLRSLPNADGPLEAPLSSSAVNPGGHTQFQLRFPVTDCDPDTWAGKYWKSSTGAGDANCGSGDGPQLRVVYCPAPH